jgi:hypothetical protein
MRSNVFMVRGKNKWDGFVLIGEFDGGVPLMYRALSHIGLCTVNINKYVYILFFGTVQVFHEQFQINSAIQAVVHRKPCGA